MAAGRPDDRITFRGGGNATRLRDGSIVLRIHEWPELAALLDHPATALTLDITAKTRTLDDIHRETGTREVTPEEFDELLGHLPVSPND